MLALGLAAAAMAVGGRPSWAGSSLGVVAPYAWVDVFSGRRLRAPKRWLFLVHVALALFAGLTLSAAPGPLLEVLGGKDLCRPEDRLRMQPAHGHALVGGHQGRRPPP